MEATVTPSDLTSETYNAQSAIREEDNGDNSSKLFPKLLSKETPEEESSGGTLESHLPPIEEDEDRPPTRVQPSRQAQPKEDSISEDWLQEHLKNEYPEVKPLRALEFYTERVLRETFPEAEITAQSTEVPGIRPDLVLKQDGRTVVLDAKHFTAGNIRKRADVDKLLHDMDAYGACSGVLLVLDEARISESLWRYCENYGVAIVEVNRQLASNLLKAINNAPSRRPSNALGPLKKDGTKANYERRGSKAEAHVPLTNDGIPDMRFKANQGRRDSNSETSGPFKKDGTLDIRVKANQERINSKSEALAPLKKDGTADKRLKTKQGRRDSNLEALRHLKKDGALKVNHDRKNSDALGPLKKGGMPDMRSKANHEPLKNAKSSKKVDFVPEYLPSITNRYLAPLKKDGTPDLRNKANYDLPSMHYPTHSKVSYPGFSGSQYYSYNGNPSGPLTKAGFPDMRYKANRY